MHDASVFGFKGRIKSLVCVAYALPGYDETMICDWTKLDIKNTLTMTLTVFLIFGINVDCLNFNSVLLQELCLVSNANNSIEQLCYSVGMEFEPVV